MKKGIFKTSDRVVVFNSTEWSKTGDLPQGNEEYYQPATVLKVRKSIKYGEWLADVLFDNGLMSNGHFQSGMKLVIC